MRAATGQVFYTLHDLSSRSVYYVCGAELPRQSKLHLNHIDSNDSGRTC